MSESNMQASVGSIFICYRREDSAGVTGRISDRLVDHFGRERVFMDVEAIGLGYDFRSEIDQKIKVCSIVIVVIGDEWLAEVDGKRRIDDENDRVRIEIETALRREIPIIPVLTRGLLILPRQCCQQVWKIWLTDTALQFVTSIFAGMLIP